MHAYPLTLSPLMCVYIMVHLEGFEPENYCVCKRWWAGPDLNRRPSARQASRSSTMESILEEFREYQLVDLQRSRKTAYEKVYYIRKFFDKIAKPINSVDVEDIRWFLKELSGSPATYKNVLGALKVFFRDFLGRSEVVASFKFPRQTFKPKHILTKKQLQEFYNCLSSVKEKALFLLYASSGLRRSEVLSLEYENIDFSTRMITPNGHHGETKKSWLSFYNIEAGEVLSEHLRRKRVSRSLKLFPMPREAERRLWKTAKEKSDLNITPQRLREWFCSEMLTSGVQECYVDAFCGRVPKSVLARHYTDYSPRKLKRIYDKARLAVLS